MIAPDGTGLVVQERMKSQPRLHLLTRKKKKGLGRAYLAGFEWGLAQGFDVIVEMDADFPIVRKIYVLYWLSLKNPICRWLSLHKGGEL